MKNYLILFVLLVACQQVERSSDTEYTPEIEGSDELSLNKESNITELSVDYSRMPKNCFSENFNIVKLPNGKYVIQEPNGVVYKHQYNRSWTAQQKIYDVASNKRIKWYNNNITE